MALDDDRRLVAFASVAEAYALFRDRLMPYLVMSLLMTLPWALALAAGVFDPMADFAVQSATGNPDFSLYPLGTIVWSAVLAIPAMLLFGVFWHRYLLLGQEGALRFGPAALASMVLRSAGYLAVFFLLWLPLFALCFLAALLAAMVGGILAAAFFGEQASIYAGFLIGPAAHVPPVIILARFSLVFPAIAVGERMTLAQSWAATKGSTLSFGGAILAAAAPMMVLAWGLYFGVFALLGIDVMDPLATAAIYDRWPVHLALGPVWMLSTAMALAVVAIAYRDLGGAAAAEEPDLSYAH